MHHDRRRRRTQRRARDLLAVVGALALAVGFFGFGVAAPASAQDHQIDICHATSSDGNPYVRVPVPKKQISQANGHQNGQGVHPDDIIPPFDAGQENPGQTWDAFGGQNWDSDGRAIYDNGCQAVDDDDDDDGEDLCANLDGDQAEVPDGLELDDQGNCVEPEADDVCPNLDGDQAEVPDGLVLDGEGDCVEEETPSPDDVCPNVDGTQTEVPDGLLVDGDGDCVAPDESSRPPAGDEDEVLGVEKTRPEAGPTPAAVTAPAAGEAAPAAEAAESAPVPTSVDAGLTGDATSPLAAAVLGAGGMLLLVALTTRPRRARGDVQA